VHRRHRAGVCHRIVVTHDCVIPAKHEANVSVHMEYEGVPIPPCDWAIESRGLCPGVMATRTLFSDSQSQLVACVLNNSLKPKSLRANSLLSMAEPVQCLSHTGNCELNNSLFADSDVSSDLVLPDESAMPVLSSLYPTMAQTDGTELCTLTVSLTTAEPTYSDSSTLPAGDAHDHINNLLHSLPSDLSDEQRDRAETFIRSCTNVFSRSEYDIGHTNIIPHHIDTGDHSPHFEQLRHHPTALLPVVDKHVRHMLEHDVIEPAASPWCSNVVMVRKQDGTMRLCIDYRKLNGLTTKDKFQLPKIDSCLDTLNGCKFVSTCDLHWGYW